MMHWRCSFERHSPLAFGIARAILSDDGEAEEVVQRVFLEVFRAANQFDRERGSFTTWLLQYVYHRSIDRKAHLRNNRVYRQNELDDGIPIEQFYGLGRRLCLPPQELACLVKEVLAKLQPHVREVVELTYFEGLTAEENSIPGRVAYCSNPELQFPAAARNRAKGNRFHGRDG